MQDNIASGVKLSAGKMFNEATGSVKSDLQVLLRHVKSTVQTEVNQISGLIRKDYENILRNYRMLRKQL
jgi:hypothetical protein